jgi:hypothetical membrane protein
MRSRWRASLWFCCFQFFVAEQITRLGWIGHYSMARNYISDLGAAVSPLHWVMNGSFVLQGLLIFLGAMLVRDFFPARWLYRCALILFAISGAGVFLVGLFPEDTNAGLHVEGAVAHFLGGNLAMIVLGHAWIRQSVCGPIVERWKSWFTFACGSVGLLATIALAFRGSPSWTWDTGSVERLAAYPIPLWLTWRGYLWVRQR